MLAVALLACLSIAVAVLPLQVAAIAGYAIQRLWHHGEPGLVDPLLPVVVFSGTLTLLALAWGPLAAGRGSGALAVEALQGPAAGASRSESGSESVLQDPAVPDPRQAAAALPDGAAGLDWRVQLLARLPLLLLSQLAGVALGIETVAASFGATALLTLRNRQPLLQAVPLPLLTAIGAGAGLGSALRSPLLGVAYALECLGSRAGLPLLLPTLLLAGGASLFSLQAALPARLALPLAGGSLPSLLPAAQGGTLPPTLPLQAMAGLSPLLLPWALLLALFAALLGAALRYALLRITPQLDRWLQQRFLPTALLLAALITALAHSSGGISLHDGGLDLGPALAGQAVTPRWAALPRLLSPLLAAASGAPGGLAQDCMSVGALMVAPLVRKLAVDQQAILIGLGAAVVFSATCRTPLLAALFVFVQQGNGSSLPLLLIASAVGSAVSLAIADPAVSPLQGAAAGSRPASAAEQRSPWPATAATLSLLNALPLPAPEQRLSAGRPSDGGA